MFMIKTLNIIIIKINITSANVKFTIIMVKFTMIIITFIIMVISAVGRESRDGKFPGIPGFLAFPFPGN